MVPRKLYIHMQKMKLDSCLTAPTKINSSCKCIQNNMQPTEHGPNRTLTAQDGVPAGLEPPGI